MYEKKMCNIYQNEHRLDYMKDDTRLLKELTYCENISLACEQFIVKWVGFHYWLGSKEQSHNHFK